MTGKKEQLKRSNEREGERVEDKGGKEHGTGEESKDRESTEVKEEKRQEEMRKRE